MSLFSRLFRRGEPGSEEGAEQELSEDAAGAPDASSAAPETVAASPAPEPVASNESAAIAPPGSRADAAKTAPSPEATPVIEAKQPPPAAPAASAKASPTAPTQKKAAPRPPASSPQAPLPRASSPQPPLPRASAPGAPPPRTSSPGVTPAGSPKPPTKAAAPKPMAPKAAEATATTPEAAETSAATAPLAEATPTAPSAVEAEAKEAPALGAPPVKADAPDPAPAPASSAANDAAPASPESAAAEAKPEALPPARVEAKPVAPPAPDPRKRFDDASKSALRPLVQLMLQLRSGSAPTAWAKRCLPALCALRPLASELKDDSVGAALDATMSALEAPGRLGRATIEGELREGVLRAYATLAERVSAAIDIEEEHGRRDPVVVDALLHQIDGVHKAALDKIYEAGWSSTERFLGASPEELDRATGVGRELAERIVAAFRAFREEFPTAAPDPMRAEELRRLGERLDRLREEQSRFERACSEWSDAALIDRRALRRSRMRTLQSIHLLLARMGEVERIGALERAPYPKKIAELAEYLRAEKSRATAVA